MESSRGRIAAPWMDRETIRFANVNEFFSLSRESDSEFEYTVAWIDCLGRGKHLGLGLLQRANHADRPVGVRSRGSRRMTVPVTPPFSLVNAVSLRAFNTVYYHRQLSKRARGVDDFNSFFFPLDGIGHWNRLYGPKGFFQYQCVIPAPAEEQAVAALLETSPASSPHRRSRTPPHAESAIAA